MQLTTVSFTDADPGDGKLKANSNTITSITHLYIDNEDVGENDITAWLDVLGDSTSTDKGMLTITKKDDDSVFAVFKITADATDGSGYRQLGVDEVTPTSGTMTAKFGSGTAIDVVLSFARTGDKGDTGDTGATGAAGPEGPTGAINVLSACAAATTANITLSAEQTIDGVATDTDRVLVKNQTAASENGVYVTAAGAWPRATDFDEDGEVAGSFVFVTGGTANADTGWVCTNEPESVQVGTDSITFAQFAFATISASAIASGTLDDARIAESNVTQHEEAINHDALLNSAADEHIDWTTASDNLQTSGTLESSIATGTAPLIIASTTAVANLATAMPYGHAWQTVISSASAGEIIFGAAGVGTDESGVTWDENGFFWEIDTAGVYEAIFSAILQPSSGTGWGNIYIKNRIGNGEVFTAYGMQARAEAFYQTAGYSAAVKNVTVRYIRDLDAGDKVRASVASASTNTVFLRRYSQFTIRRIA
tara:strand:+ start:190 stop:1635 length:1446 start_codon:yes stop_codon:yes gene_type:complete